MNCPKRLSRFISTIESSEGKSAKTSPIENFRKKRYKQVDCPMRKYVDETGFMTPIENRYFEDYVAGSVHECGSILVEKDEIIAFAKRFDPQPLHTDPETARENVFGGLIASGWHTASLMMRLFVDHYLSRVASLSSPGVDELRWLKPVRPDDMLSLRVTVLETVRSRSKPEKGILHSYIEFRNQEGEVVMTMKAMNLLACRETVL